MTIEERIRGRKIGVIGMARSGIAAALLARQYGGVPFVTDAAPLEKLTEQVARLDGATIAFETGGHTDRILASDYIIISPGVKLTLPIVAKARQKGIPLFSELEFASWVCRGKIVAITGTNGKTTTTALTGALFEAASIETFVCGNIGVPFAEIAAQVPRDGVAVVEVSSYQLETIDQFRPYVAVILNVTPDHLDRHGSMQAYKTAKYRITENQTDEDYFILNKEDAETMKDEVETKARHLYFSTVPNDVATTFVRNSALWYRFEGKEERIIAVEEINITGPHNLQNAAAAVSCTLPFRLSTGALIKGLKSFAGVEHRLENAGTVAGIKFINDSKATNVDSVCVALRSMTQPTYIILGGLDKGGSYLPIVEAGRDKIKGMILIGQARDLIFNALGKYFPAHFTETLEEAVAKGFELAHPGETVLLSPGCASFDMFDNFEHRGRVFKAAVAALRNGKNKGETVSR